MLFRSDILDAQAEGAERIRALETALAARPEGSTALRAALAESAAGDAGAGAWKGAADLAEQAIEWIALAPEPERWGGAAAIWGDAAPGEPMSGDARAAALDEALRALESWDATPAGRKSLAGHLRWLAERPGGAPSGYGASSAKFFDERLSPILDDLRAGQGGMVKIRKDFSIPPDLGRRIAALADDMIASEMALRRRRTRGAHGLFGEVARAWRAQTEDAGRLSFSAMARRAAERLADAGADLRARRLGERRDQWLLDEFQDTSRLQWRALHPLLAPAAKDGGVFAVGDAKQAIHGWRGGDATLFEDFAALQPEGEPMPEAPLDDSWRFGPAIASALNAALGAPARAALEATAAAGAPGASKGAARWIGGWAEQGTARPERADRFELWTAAGGEKHEAMIAWLQERRPWERGLSVAVLTRTNDQAEGVAGALRAAGIPAASESDLALARRHPACAALRSLLQAAAFPGDALAAGHIAALPHAIAAALPTADALRARIAAQGIERAIRAALPTLAAAHPAALAPLGDIADAARDWEAAGRSGLADFLRDLDFRRARDGAAPGQIECLTVHKSKGLGRDIVLLPEVPATTKLGAAPRPDTHLVEPDAQGRPRWILEAPPAAIIRADPVLRAHAAAAAARRAFEDLCLLYVAMSRAARALVIITDAKPAAGSPAALLRAALPADAASAPAADPPPAGAAGPATLAHAIGPDDWLELAIAQNTGKNDLQPAQPAIAAPPAAPSPPLRIHAALPRAAPSQWGVRGTDAPTENPPPDCDGHASNNQAPDKGSLNFSEPHHPAPDPADARAARALGSAVHRLLEEIERRPADADARDAIIRAWESRPGLPAGAAALAGGVLQSDACAGAFAPLGSERTILWRERAFECMLDGRWISGAWDRVEIALDAAGRPLAANIVDWKTDRVDAANPADLGAITERHRGQMTCYARALAAIAGLPEESITLHLCLARPRRMLAIAPAP